MGPSGRCDRWVGAFFKGRPSPAVFSQALGKIGGLNSTMPPVRVIHIATSAQLATQVHRCPGDLQIGQYVLKKAARTARTNSREQKHSGSARSVEVVPDLFGVRLGDIKNLHPCASPLVGLFVFRLCFATLPLRFETVDLPVDDHGRVPPGPKADRLKNWRIESALIKCGDLNFRLRVLSCVRERRSVGLPLALPGGVRSRSTGRGMPSGAD